MRDSLCLRVRGKVKAFMKKVNEVSRLAGVSRRTLQFYDDEGLLPAERSKDNYRLYDDTALECLWQILVYREMGLDLKEIKHMLSGSEKEKAHPRHYPHLQSSRQGDLSAKPCSL